jgi:D-sedoheptulose 7-phosphate isomerase
VGTLWLVPSADASRYGSVEVAADGRVRAFREKIANGSPGLISAGVYLLERECVAEIPLHQPVSLETEFFPALVERGLFAVTGEGVFVDIGTPETLARAGEVLRGEFGALHSNANAGDGHARARAHLTAAAELQQRLAEEGADPIVEAAGLVARSFRSGGKLLLCGNGGSAADCQHVAAEFVSRLTRDFDRPALPAIALTTDTSFLTGYANDCGFEGIFERQVHALAQPGDVVLGISTSGNSANVKRAMRAARERGAKTIGLMGQGGELAAMVDCAVVVPSADTQLVQEALLTLEHILCDLVERDLFPR